MKVIERRPTDSGISLLELEDMIIVASRSVVEGACYMDQAGATVVVRGMPVDHPSGQQKVLYETATGELHTCSLHYFVSRYKLEAAP